jgi:hypothetical protein
MPSPEWAAMVLAMFAATLLAVYMAARRNNQYAGDEMPEESAYTQEVLPQQERNHPELVARIRAKARELAAGGKQITTDDIHKAMPLPAGVDGRILGAAFYPRKDWMKTGYVPSVRKENHSRPIARWVLKGSVAA